MKSERPIEKSNRPLFLLEDIGLEYSKVKQGYILKKFNGDEEILDAAFKLVENLPDDYLLYPNGILINNKFRRCDGVWIIFEDEMSLRLLKNAEFIISQGGYANTKIGYLALAHVEKIEVDLITFAIAQLVSTGALGEFTPSELGYIPEQGTVDYKENYCIYCGQMALWETSLEGNYYANFITTAHLFRKVYDPDNEIELPLINILEERCLNENVKGFPNLKYEGLCYKLACEIEGGQYQFVDEPPEYYTRSLKNKKIKRR